MKAIVCDNCGKVVLIPELGPTYGETGIHHLISHTLEVRELDLCDECATNLVEAVRNQKNSI